ncbi:hypothetical protein B4121_0700 [Bacillus paralicheniformis]|uniref:Uncharacterized protein n=1 Tax=Bacillus paralicheniformis TaxID=1648923 RepID=A0A7Z0X155_9BACI|nr:hypothetical protein B4121_0700 [Bacillus paralicheniformis]
MDLEKSNSPAFSSKKQNKLDKNRSDYKNPTYFVNSLKAANHSDLPLFSAFVNHK